MKRVALFFLTFIILVITSFLIVPNSNGQKKEMTKTVRVEKGEVVLKILETGIVNPIRQFNIQSKISGRIIEVKVKEGDYVAEADTVILLDRSISLSKLKQAKESLRQTELEIEQAHIRVEYTRSDLENCQELFKKGLIAKYELERAKREYDLSKIQLNTAYSKKIYVQENYTTVLNELKNTTIKAPISGRIIKKMVKTGEIIASISQPLLVIGDLSQMVIKVEVNEMDINNIKAGQPAVINFDAVKEKSYKGLVSKIALSGNLKINVVTYEIEIKIIDPDDRIKLGMTCDTNIIIAKAENVLYLPVQLIKRKNGKNLVLVKTGDNFIWREVITGIDNDNYVEIRKGLKEGEIVKFPSFKKWEETLEEIPSGRPRQDFN